MKRRNFIKSLLPLGLCAGGFYNLSAFSDTLLKNIIVKNGSPSERFKKGIEELGGINNFVKKGDRVVIKPTMAFNMTPDFGYNSDPYLIEEIINQCIDADVKVISVFDQTYDTWTKCYKNSGIERIAKDAYARVLPANDERFYSESNFNNTEILNPVKIHKAVSEADAIINVAAARLDNFGQYWGAAKNMAGCVWNRKLYESKEYIDYLFALVNQINPVLNIVDAKAFQVISTNCLVGDLATLKTLSLDVESCSYLKKILADRKDLLDETIENIKEITL